MLSDIPRIPGWLGVIFRFIGAARNEIRSRARTRARRENSADLSGVDHAGRARLRRNRQSRRRRVPAVVKPVRAATNRVDRQCLYAA